MGRPLSRKEMIEAVASPPDDSSPNTTKPFLLADAQESQARLFKRKQ
jgi:hypothetical protein